MSFSQVRHEPSGLRGGRLARCHGDRAKDSHSPRRSEELLASREDIVERVLEVGGRLGKLTSDLLYVLFVALLDLLAKELLERAIANSFLPLAREVGDDVGNERACQPLG